MKIQLSRDCSLSIVLILGSGSHSQAGSAIQNWTLESVFFWEQLKFHLRFDAKFRQHWHHLTRIWHWHHPSKDLASAVPSRHHPSQSWHYWHHPSQNLTKYKLLYSSVADIFFQIASSPTPTRHQITKS